MRKRNFAKINWTKKLLTLWKNGRRQSKMFFCSFVDGFFFDNCTIEHKKIYSANKYSWTGTKIVSFFSEWKPVAMTNFSICNSIHAMHAKKIKYMSMIIRLCWDIKILIGLPTSESVWIFCAMRQRFFLFFSQWMSSDFGVDKMRTCVRLRNSTIYNPKIWKWQMYKPFEVILPILHLPYAKPA